MVKKTLMERIRGVDPALVRLIVFFGGLTAVVVLLIVFDQIFLPLLLGLTVAYLLDPAVSWFERRGWSRVFGVIAICLVLLLAVVGFFLYLVPTVGTQVERVSERMPEYRERLSGQLEPWMERVQARYPDQLKEAEERARTALSEHFPDVIGIVGKWLRGLFSNVLGVFLFLLNLIFVPVFAFYLLVDMPKIRRGAKSLIPVPYRENVLARLSEVNQAVAGFVRGQLTIAMILAFINAVGLLVIGVPMGLLIGIVAGMANMIPYMALVVGLTPALILCWAEHQSLLRLVAVVAVFSGAQLLEGTVLSPRILGDSVDLHPVWVLLAVIAGGSLFGVVGMLIAVPAAAAIQVFIRHWLKVYRQSAVYDSNNIRAPGAD